MSIEEKLEKMSPEELERFMEEIELSLVSNCRELMLKVKLNKLIIIGNNNEEEKSKILNMIEVLKSDIRNLIKKNQLWKYFQREELEEVGFDSKTLDIVEELYPYKKTGK